MLKKILQYLLMLIAPVLILGVLMLVAKTLLWAGAIIGPIVRAASLL